MSVQQLKIARFVLNLGCQIRTNRCCFLEGEEGVRDVYVGNLTWDTSDEELFEFLSQSGELVSAGVRNMFFSLVRVSKTL